MTDSELSPAAERRLRKQAYHGAISYLDHNTGGMQPPLHREEPLVAQVSLQGFSGEIVRNAIRKARQDGEVFRWQHDETGDYYLGLNDADALRHKIRKHVSLRQEPNKSLIGIANQRVDSIGSV